MKMREITIRLSKRLHVAMARRDKLHGKANELRAEGDKIFARAQLADLADDVKGGAKVVLPYLEAVDLRLYLKETREMLAKKGVVVHEISRNFVQLRKSK